MLTKRKLHNTGSQRACGKITPKYVEVFSEQEFLDFLDYAEDQINALPQNPAYPGPYSVQRMGNWIDPTTGDREFYWVQTHPSIYKGTLTAHGVVAFHTSDGRFFKIAGV